MSLEEIPKSEGAIHELFEGLLKKYLFGEDDKTRPIKKKEEKGNQAGETEP